MLALFLVAAALAVGPTVEVTTVDGVKTAGVLSELSAEQVVLETGDGPRTFAQTEILLLASIAEPSDAQPGGAKAKVWVELTDGSKLTGVSYTAAKGKARLGTGQEDAIDLPLSAVRWVRFSQPDDQADAAWSAHADGGLTADLIAVRKKTNVDFLEGVIGDVTDDSVTFELDGDKIPVKRAKIDGLVYFHQAGGELPESASVLEDAAGWRLSLKSVKQNGDKLSVETVSGVKLDRPLAGLVRLDYSSGKVVYLSQLDPESTQWSPFFDFSKESPSMAAFFQPRRDRGLDQGSLTLGSKVFTRGLAVASRTRLSYKVPPKSKKLKALVGIADSVGDEGSISLEIIGDGKKLFQRKITGKDEPLELDVDLKGVRRLAIVVDYGEDLDVGDYLNLCEARIVR